MIDNKKLITLLNLLVNYISARSAPEILSIIGECGFLFSNFLIIDLRNSSANSLFHMFSFLTANLFRAAKTSDRANVVTPPADFLSKN